MDSSESPTYGEQEGSAYNGHFGCTCYHPLFVFNQLGDLERCALRPGNVHSADGWRAVPVTGGRSAGGADPNQAPPHEATHRTAPAMAKAVEISPSSVRRIWKRHGLQPHRVRSFKFQRPRFVQLIAMRLGLGEGLALVSLYPPPLAASAARSHAAYFPS